MMLLSLLLQLLLVMRVDGGIKDSDGDTGSGNQVLASTGGGGVAGLTVLVFGVISITIEEEGSIVGGSWFC